MQWSCRQEIEDALWEAARATLSRGAVERKRLVQAVTERTALYTSEREHLDVAAAGRADAADLAARALFFTVADALKIAVPLSELANRQALPAGESWKVLDVGAGVGAMSFGLLSFAMDHGLSKRVSIRAVDYDPKALELMERAMSCLRPALPTGLEVQTTTEHRSLATLEASARYDLVLAGSVFNELDGELRRSLAKVAYESLSDEGVMILIEPALRDSSRQLHEIRDLLIGEGAQVFAPCTHSCSPCPALADASDWCHEDRASVLPSRARQISQTTGLRDGATKFSYVVLKKRPCTLVELASGKRAFRVVSQPQKSKGQREGFVCSDLGRHRLRLLKRNRSGSNRLFERARRGEVVVADAELRPQEKKGVQRLDLEKGDEVELKRPS